MNLLMKWLLSYHWSENDKIILKMCYLIYFGQRNLNLAFGQMKDAKIKNCDFFSRMQNIFRCFLFRGLWKARNLVVIISILLKVK